jgi:hypothetical protein
LRNRAGLRQVPDNQGVATVDFKSSIWSLIFFVTNSGVRLSPCPRLMTAIISYIVLPLSNAYAGFVQGVMTLFLSMRACAVIKCHAAPRSFALVRGSLMTQRSNKLEQLHTIDDVISCVTTVRLRQYV